MNMKQILPWAIGLALLAFAWKQSNTPGTWLYNLLNPQTATDLVSTEVSDALKAVADLTGSGVRPMADSNPTWYTSHGPRACGFPLIAGLIRTEEIEAGRIDHALVLAYPHIRAGIYTSPASTAQTRIGDDSIKSRGIPCEPGSTIARAV